MKVTIRRGALAALTLGAALVASTATAGAVTHAAAAALPTTPHASGPAGHVHRVHAVQRGQVSHAAGATYNSTSTNWAGYAAYGGTFTSASGSWTVPTVNCSWGATGASSTWVGLDGYGNGTVEQLGTHQDCLWGGASYHPWYELYPAYEVSLPSSYQVFPGDRMTAWVQYLNTKDAYSFHMQDLTRGWVWNLVVASPTGTNRPSNATAEWINEQPSCFYQCTWLSNYGTVSFTAAEASRPSAPLAPISAFPHDPITQVDGSGNPKQIPSGLTDYWNGSAFSVRFVHS